MLRFGVGVAFVFVAAISALASEPGQPRTLTFEDRVAAQRAIEEVYWRHRIWPQQRSSSKPQLHDVLPDSAIRAKVEECLIRSGALELSSHLSITPEVLDAELARIARDTRNPLMLREIFGALDNNLLVLAQTFAREVLVDRLTADLVGTRIDASAIGRDDSDSSVPIAQLDCAGDSWRPISLVGAPSARASHTSVWTVLAII